MGLTLQCEEPLFGNENGVTNEAWLRRWFISALMETFPQLKQYARLCNRYIDLTDASLPTGMHRSARTSSSSFTPSLALRPRVRATSRSLTLPADPVSSTDEDEFALVLQDFFFDLAQFRLGDNSAFLLREKERRAEERETRRKARGGRSTLSGALVSSNARAQA